MQTLATAMREAPSGRDRRRWSLDARVMTQPSRTFRELATRPLEAGLGVALRRPLTMALGLGCMASLLAAGSVTFRLLAPTVLYLSYAPLTQLLAVSLVLLGTRHQQSFSAALDAYFAGRTPLLLMFLLVVLTLASVSNETAWRFLTTVGVGLMVVGLAWSVRIDYCYFRDFLRQSPAAAATRTILLRVIVWPVVFGVFAVPGMSYGAFVAEIAGVGRELFGGG